MFLGLPEVQQLYPHVPYLFRGQERPDCLTGWISLEHAPTPYVTHLLYVCEHDEGLGALPLVPNMNVLCLVEEGTDRESVEREFPSNINLLVLERVGIQDVSRALIEFFDIHCGIGLFSDTLLRMLSYDEGVQPMVDHAFQALGNPIFVFDAGFKLIAATWEEAVKANAGIEVIENEGFTDREFEMVNRRNHIHERLKKSEEPLEAYNNEYGYTQLLCSIDTKKDLGHIVVDAVNRPVNPIDTKFIKILRRCISLQLRKDEFYRNTKGFNYEYFLRDLLDGKIALGKPFLSRLNYAGGEFSGNMYCLVVETNRTTGTLNTSHIRTLFEGRFPESKTLMYNGGIIAIINIAEDSLLSKDALSDIASVCDDNDLFAGLSNCFQNIIELPGYYKQALQAIELGTRNTDASNLFRYEDYYLDHVKSVFLEKESSTTFCHPKMKLLLDHDSAHDSELAYTLYMYLVHERNVASAASAMHMHRNSVVYRLKKIGELIGDDYESVRERQYLILSYETNRSHPSKEGSAFDPAVL